MGSYRGSHSRPHPEPRALPVYWGQCWPTQPRALEVAMVGGLLDSVTGLMPGFGSLRVLVSHLEPGTLMGRGLASG